MNIIIYNTIAYTLIVYIYVATFIFFYAMYMGRDLNIEPIFGIKFFNFNFFSIGCLIGLIIFLAAGIERAFFFIPESWGYLNEDGITWHSTKEIWSYIFAFPTSVILLVKLNKIFSKKEKK